MKKKSNFTAKVFTFGGICVAAPVLSWALPTIGAALHVALVMIGAWRCASAMTDK